ncbi:preprotein translocase subunit SecG [Mycoplasma sp. 6243]|uniref:preprotein translocase subunit SecG n=1 Tax=Mycoplasma sp. 6243 TaxID=3440865 RepID=UPI003EBB7FB1
MIALTVILIIISFVILIVSFLMSPDSNGFSGALVGSGDLDLFKISKERGVKKALKYTMIALGILLFVIAILLRVFVH